MSTWYPQFHNVPSVDRQVLTRSVRRSPHTSCRSEGLLTAWRFWFELNALSLQKTQKETSQISRLFQRISWCNESSQFGEKKIQTRVNYFADDHESFNEGQSPRARVTLRCQNNGRGSDGLDRTAARCFKACCPVCGYYRSDIILDWDFIETEAWKVFYSVYF